VTLAAFPRRSWRGSRARACLEILGQEYIRTGRAKGLGEPRVVLRHALKNATIRCSRCSGFRSARCSAAPSSPNRSSRGRAWQAGGRRDLLPRLPVVQTILILSATIFVVITCSSTCSIPSSTPHPLRMSACSGSR